MPSISWILDTSHFEISRLSCPVGSILSTTLHLTGTSITNGVVFEIRLVLGWGVERAKHIVDVRHVPLRNVALELLSMPNRLELFGTSHLETSRLD